MPPTVGTMQEGGAIVQIKRLAFMFFNEFHSRSSSPFRVVTLKGRLRVVPVNILGPGEAVILDYLPKPFFIFKLLLIELFCERHVFLHIMQSVFFAEGRVTE